MTINQAYLIKGWLLGEHPPKEVLDAIDAVIAGLAKQPDRLEHRITGEAAPIAVLIPHQSDGDPGDGATERAPESVKKRRGRPPKQRGDESSKDLAESGEAEAPLF